MLTGFWRERFGMVSSFELVRWYVGGRDAEYALQFG